MPDLDTPSPSTATQTPIDGALMIPLAMLAPCAAQPRRIWRQARIEQIAESLRTLGQIQPIRVRPNPEFRAGNGRPPYEIVVGETRWRAAQLAKLPMLEAVVREYTDLEALEIQLSENVHRQDLHPIEEAEGYNRMLRTPTGLQGYESVPAVAARVGVSSSTVYQRLKLLALCPAARDAFLGGQFDAGVALLIARMPNAEEQARATARIVAGFGGEPYSYRQAAEYLRKEFMLRIDLARFDPAATYKVAGPCAGCSKRSGAEPDLFADVTGGDMCQDARCYQAKAEEAHLQLLQAARDAGRTVLQGAAARAIMPNPQATPVGHYRLDAPCPALTDSQRPLSALLGKGASTQVVVLDLPDTPPIELVSEANAYKAIKARGLLRQQTQGAKPAPAGKAVHPSPAAAAAAPSSATAAQQPPQSAPTVPLLAGQAPQAGGAGANKQDADKPWWEDPDLAQTPEDDVERAPAGTRRGGDNGDDEDTLARFGQLLFTELHERVVDAPELDTLSLRLVLELLFDDQTFEETRLVYSAMRWDIEAAVEKGKGLAADFIGRVAASDGRTLGNLLSLMLAAPDCSTSYATPEALQRTRTPAAALAKHYGIDLQRVLRDARIAAGAAARTAAGQAVAPDATAAFLAAHGTAQAANAG